MGWTVGEAEINDGVTLLPLKSRHDGHYIARIEDGIIKIVKAPVEFFFAAAAAVIKGWIKEDTS